MSQSISTLVVCEYGQPRPSWATYTEGPFGGGGSVGGVFSPYTVYRLTPFTCQAGSVTIDVSDIASDGDVYEVALDGVRLFQTSTQTYPSGSGSTGTWTGTVTEGTHYIEVWDILLSYIGYDSPFGNVGFPVDISMSPAGVFLQITCPDAPTGAIKRRHVKIHA